MKQTDNEVTSYATDFSTSATTSEIATLFGVAKCTVVSWRRKKNPIPVSVIPSITSRTIRYDLDAVITWAKQTGRRPLSKQASVSSARRFIQDSVKKIDIDKYRVQ